MPAKLLPVVVAQEFGMNERIMGDEVVSTNPWTKRQIWWGERVQKMWQVWLRKYDDVP
jgi:hypothetical protein